MDAPRVRFAPSPTGFFHVGSARTALFNWLFAHQHGGTLLLRIEDTDEERNREEWVDGIVEAMAWLGLAPDEPPVRQSEFAPAHMAASTRLLDAGYLYGCDCTRVAIDGRLKGSSHTGYDGHCRDRGLGRGPGIALRFRVPDDGETVVHDIVRGDVSFPNESLDDFVVERSNGTVLFTLSNLVDDREMRITHVIRAEEHLPNTPKQLLLAAALDEAEHSVAPTPAFAHLPWLVNEKRQKLSKRRDPVAVEMYRDQGYLSEAIVNFLALLGWSPKGDDEMVPRSVLLEQFTLEAVNHSPAYFDVAKLTHLNGMYIRALSPDAFLDACRPWVDPQPGMWTPSDHQPPWPAERFDADVFTRMAPLIQERVSTLGEVCAMVDFLFLPEAPIDQQALDKAVLQNPAARDVVVATLAALSDAPFEATALQEAIAAVGDGLSLPLRKAQAPIRVAITGRSIGPPLFESMALLGRDEVTRRLRRVVELIG